jgi:hypothetical protein
VKYVLTLYARLNMLDEKTMANHEEGYEGTQEDRIDLFSDHLPILSGVAVRDDP